MSVDFAAVRGRHSLAAVARRTGYDLPQEAGDVFVSCPMPGHEENTPSMLLHLDDGRYHCFGCGAGGDVVQWVRDIYDVDTRTALSLLDEQPDAFPAAPAGTSPRREVRRHDRSDAPDLQRTSPARVREALAAAWRYYTLPRLAEKAVAYLSERGIDVDGLGDVAGHTPYNPDQLIAQLRKRGFSDDELVDAGLARRREGEATADFFQHRVMLAVRDDDGAVIGLIGRTTLTNSRAPKYLNSPLTVTYDKTQALYSPTTERLADDGQVVMVEGSLDALAIAAAARRARLQDRFRPVCTSGLSFSDDQVRHVLAMHPRAPVLALDGDSAGARAAGKAAATIAHHGREATLVTWPTGEDPASWLATQGPGGLRAVTRRGCLEPGDGSLRPHHAGAAAAAALLEVTEGSLERRVSAALEPAQRMTDAAAGRYAAHAAEAIAPVVVAAAASVSADSRGRVTNVLETVATYGRRFPPAAQARFVERAVLEIEKEELAPSSWAERQITTRLKPGASAQAAVAVTRTASPAQSCAR